MQILPEKAASWAGRKAEAIKGFPFLQKKKDLTLYFKVLFYLYLSYKRLESLIKVDIKEDINGRKIVPFGV